MRKRGNEVFTIGLLFVLVTSSAIAASGHATTETGIVEYAEAPDQKADAIVVYTPTAHHALDKMESFERVLKGRVETQEKGNAPPNLIVHKANTMIMPLEAGMPVRLYLKRFPDRDAYYPIAIFPVSQGAK